MRRDLNIKVINVQLNKKLNYVSGAKTRNQHNNIKDNKLLPKNNSTISGNKILFKNNLTQFI
jgi:hypothetical protein